MNSYHLHLWFRIQAMLFDLALQHAPFRWSRFVIVVILNYGSDDASPYVMDNLVFRYRSNAEFWIQYYAQPLSTSVYTIEAKQP